MGIDSVLPGVGSVLSGVGGVVSSIINQRNVKKQLQAQREENEKSRQFNAQESALARQYNTDMVNAQNAYNSPAQMVERLKSAGLHPGLVYGDLSSGPSVGVGSTGAQASSQGSVGSVLPDTSGLTAPGQAALQYAQTRLIEAQARKTESETDLNNTELQYLGQIREGEIKLQNVSINLGNSQTSFTEEQQRNLAKQTSKLDLDMQMLGAQIVGQNHLNTLTREQAFEKIIDNNLKSETYEERKRALIAQCGMDETNASYLVRMLDADLALKYQHTAESASNVGVNVHKVGLLDAQKVQTYRLSDTEVQKLKNLKTEGVNLEKYGIQLDVTNEGIRLQNYYSDTYGDAEHTINIIKNAVGIFK